MSEEPNSTTRRTFLQKGATVAGSLAASSPMTAQSKKLRIGVVGGGFGSSFPWHMHPNCAVTAVADLREARLMDRFDCPNAYGEVELRHADAPQLQHAIAGRLPAQYALAGPHVGA